MNSFCHHLIFVIQIQVFMHMISYRYVKQILGLLFQGSLLCFLSFQSVTKNRLAWNRLCLFCFFICLYYSDLFEKIPIYQTIKRVVYQDIQHLETCANSSFMCFSFLYSSWCWKSYGTHTCTLSGVCYSTSQLYAFTLF